MPLESQIRILEILLNLALVGVDKTSFNKIPTKIMHQNDLECYDHFNGKDGYKSYLALRMIVSLS